MNSVFQYCRNVKNICINKFKKSLKFLVLRPNKRNQNKVLQLVEIKSNMFKTDTGTDFPLPRNKDTYMFLFLFFAFWK